MSLLALKNFKGPFTNPVHVVTILLVTVLFGVFRWSNGGLSFGSGARAQAAPASAAIEEPPHVTTKSPEQHPAAETRPATTTARPASKNNDLLDDMLRNSPDKGAKPAAPAHTDTRKGGGKDPGLADIEKSLGLK